ncbi:carbamoyltransferase [Verrucomicrobiota bacterium]
MSVILGVNAFHVDSSACLVVDGELKSAISEERLGGRKKHTPCFPSNAIRAVMKRDGVELKDITHVAIARNPRANISAKVKYALTHPVRSYGAIKEHGRRNLSANDMPSMLSEVCATDLSDARFETVGVEHHLAHIASAYYLSPFDGLTAGFSYDASGDFVSAMAARCEGRHIEVLDRVYLPHSLGFFYSAICQFIGFTDFSEEYKVMGLSAYGNDSYRDLMARLLRLSDSKWFSLNTRYFGMHAGGVSDALDEAGRIKMGKFYTQSLVDLLGPPRKRENPITEREKDLARSCQCRFEETAMHCMMKLHSLVSSEQLAMAGGCALNGLVNSRIFRDTPFQKTFLQPAASDDGTCLGAAYYCYHNVVGGEKRFHMKHSFWGNEYMDSEMKQASLSSGCLYKRYDDKELLNVVARYLNKGKVVGWFQGRSEWGPRALGNRSILANPSALDMKETINTKIKRRELFRPFAPSVLHEFVPTYFEQTVDSPFMMHVVKIRSEWRDKLSSVCHVDGTGRLQSVTREYNPRYYDLIETFMKQSGVGAVLNTSFNENEPIVEAPEEAVRCFKRTDMDVLCLGNYVITKPMLDV